MSTADLERELKELVHGRREGAQGVPARKLFELADIASKVRDQRRPTISPIAFEAVRRIDAIFAAERSSLARTRRRCARSADRKNTSNPTWSRGEESEAEPLSQLTSARNQ